ncbi:MAG: hypothetical protein QM751_06140 [Paludibacteraceae bacterium]
MKTKIFIVSFIVMLSVNAFSQRELKGTNSNIYIELCENLINQDYNNVEIKQIEETQIIEITVNKELYGYAINIDENRGIKNTYCIIPAPTKKMRDKELTKQISIKMDRLMNENKTNAKLLFTYIMYKNWKYIKEEE